MANMKKVRTSNEQTIKEVISDWMEGTTVKSKLAEVNVINAWENLVGNIIARNTQKIFFKNGKLFLEIESPPLRQELSYSKSKLIEIVNKFVGEEFITDVVVR